MRPLVPGLGTLSSSLHCDPPLTHVVRNPAVGLVVGAKQPVGAENPIHAWSLVPDATLWAPNRSSGTPDVNSWEAILDADPVHAFV